MRLPGFNPRSRTGNDVSWKSLQKMMLWFQSTFPHGERLTKLLERMDKDLCFNPRSRTGNDVASCNGCGEQSHVSIHVPARGTTDRARKRGYQNIVSIHVPARGTTQNHHRASLLSRFQSTFPHGERQTEPPREVEAITVSIHVPARGTTTFIIPCILARQVSIHVPARGTTIEDSLQMLYERLFQSTFPHGERRWRADCSVQIFQVSIHVPARGTTVLRMSTNFSTFLSFNPRSRTGND